MSLLDVEGIDFTLLKTNTLNPADWIPVSGTQVVREAGKVILTDPDPGSDRAFYRVQVDLSNNGQN
jgi:hypothetical protein